MTVSREQCEELARLDGMPAGFHDQVAGLVEQAFMAGGVDIAEPQLVKAANQMRLAFASAIKPDDLSKCSGASIATCIYLSAATELYPGPPGSKPDVWLVPRDGRLCWQMGLHTADRLARRALHELDASAVYVGEPFKVEKPEHPAEPWRVRHEPDFDSDRGWDSLRLVYTWVYRLGGGGYPRPYFLTKQMLDARRAVSQSWRKHESQGKASPWASWPEEMALRTGKIYCLDREAFPLDRITRTALQSHHQADPLPELEASSRPVLTSATRILAATATMAENEGPELPHPAEDEPQAEPVPAEDESQEPPEPKKGASRPATTTGKTAFDGCRELVAAGAKGGEITKALRGLKIEGEPVLARTQTWEQVSPHLSFDDVELALPRAKR